MTWFGYLLIAVWVLGIFVNIATIGRPRSPLTPSTVAVIVLINGLLIWGVLAVGTHS